MEWTGREGMGGNRNDEMNEREMMKERISSTMIVIETTDEEEKNNIGGVKK